MAACDLQAAFLLADPAALQDHGSPPQHRSKSGIRAILRKAAWAVGTAFIFAGKFPGNYRISSCTLDFFRSTLPRSFRAAGFFQLPSAVENLAEHYSYRPLLFFHW
jgi:hypothetical protein